MKDSQSRRYLLTINNPQPEFSHEKIKQIATMQFKTLEFIAMSDEIGEQGTYHTHVLLCFVSAVRFSTVKKRFSTAHIDPVKGTINDVITYIKKIGKWAETKKAETSVPGTYDEWGKLPSENKGRNKSLEELYKMIVDEGLSNAEIIRINQDYLTMIDTITRVRTMFLQEKFKNTRRNISCTYVFGKTGAGKSRNILDEYGDENVYRVTDYDHPFDSYNNEDVLVFEEFRSSLKITDILNYLDIYPLTLPARYAQKQACYTIIFICSNLPLEDQYELIQKTNKESWKAFLRRIHVVREYTQVGVYTDYSVEEYFKSRKSPWSVSNTNLQDEIPF
ncbi:MAG: replication protein [Lachnospiraceae bacterium]|nr:replication protein [Lachnospiraceae bacterium]